MGLEGSTTGQPPALVSPKGSAPQAVCITQITRWGAGVGSGWAGHSGPRAVVGEEDLETQRPTLPPAGRSGSTEGLWVGRWAGPMGRGSPGRVRVWVGY